MKKGMHFLWLCMLAGSLISARGSVYILSPDPNVFDVSTYLNRDEVRRPYYDFKVAFERLGYRVSQVRSLVGLRDVEKIIVFCVTHNDLSMITEYPYEKRVLFLWEPPTVYSSDYDRRIHELFSRIYTWDDDFVDNVKYFKFYDPQPRYDMPQDYVPFEQKKFCVYLTCNKTYDHPQSLSSERRKIINFFERKPRGEFDLYGYGWSRDDSQDYKGVAQSKVECMKNYKFCFCYDNMRDIKGYITGEKIFNVFVAGCVPIYWGASNIEEYIPKDCFIDKRDFATYDDLYAFLKSMSKEKYQQYLDSIRKFMQTPQALLFSPANFIDIMLNTVEPGYDKMIALTEEQRLVLKSCTEQNYSAPCNQFKTLG